MTVYVILIHRTQVQLKSSSSVHTSHLLQVYAWGLNKLGVLGCKAGPGLPRDPETGDLFQARPTLVTGLAGRVVVQVACRNFNNLALVRGGREIFAWGCAR